MRLPTLRRPVADRVVMGVGGGIARGLDADVLLVRLVGAAFLLVGGGVGVIVYGALAVLIPSEPGPVVSWSARWSARSLTAVVLAVALDAVLYLFGLQVVTPSLGVLIPVALLAAGVALVWRETVSMPREHRRPQRSDVARVLVGLALLVGGAISFLTDSRKLTGLSSALVAAAVVAAGLALLVGPQLAQARSEAEAERHQRVLADERAAVAAQLHDSVLQTLMLIQREHDPRRAQALARRQERELRGLLYGGQSADQAATFAGALRTATAEVEARYGIKVDLIQPSDGTLDDGLAALAAAAREAMTNAGRHSGEERISVLARVSDEEASVFVRDRGRGFDPNQVAGDRHGVRDSIVERMQRCGGRATVHSAPGEGTEVELVLPRTTH